MPTAFRYRVFESPEVKNAALSKPGVVVFNLQEGKQLVVNIDRSKKEIGRAHV